ncbi:DUF1214 domain-containing protein [Sediminitomix flava]|uniref:DUF1254 domain-containing protein n=1 Tax=Sediminitomix flava TaxID=379075 RepID=A0A315Z874_SEDFL|nr:DUF1214 domain-containing protein [Sediminitomix flava]PWJ41765.1 hypothetical protein BC781_10315 [Sediminitomix flava]
MKFIEHITFKTILAVLLLIYGANSSALSQNMSSEESSEINIEKKRFERRAFESAIWGQPLVAGNQMIEGAIEARQKLNQVAYFSQPPNWKFQQPTPNNSTLYLQLIYDVKDSPVVIEIPAETEQFKVFGSLLDVWQRPVVDVGGAGDDKGKGGKYFLYQADDESITVPEGYYPVPLRTYRGYGTIRIILPNNAPETLADAEEYIKTKSAQYYYNDSERLPHMDIYDMEYASVFPFDHTFFEKLQKVVNYEEIRVEDKYAMGMLSSIGIEKGGNFSPSEEQKVILDNIMSEVHLELQDHILNLPPMRWGDHSHWALPVAPSMIATQMTYEDENKIYVDDKAFTFYMYISPPVKLGKATAYLKLTHDKEGNVLDGKKNYKLTVPPNVPVSQFWSVLAYDLATASYIRNSDRIGLASTEEPQMNADGTCDIYFGPNELNNGVNYIPTEAIEHFFLLFRFYGPEKAYQDNSWMLNDIVEIK